MILDLPRGSEVIMPSFGFVSLANAVAQSGGTCVFVDCDPTNMNISPESFANAIGPKTKAVITINYAGVSCDYEKIKAICSEGNLVLIEDNAHGLLSQLNGQPLGSFGDISTFSFDRMKNFSCFEGGAILIKNKTLAGRYREVSQYGTNRLDYLDKLTDKYEWVSIGTNAHLADPLTCILSRQFASSDKVLEAFQKSWANYLSLLRPLEEDGLIKLSVIPSSSQHNGYMFWLKVNDPSKRDPLLAFLDLSGVTAAFHYTPLHSSKLGIQIGVFRGLDQFTTTGAASLIRLPLFYSITFEEIEFVASCINQFFKNH